MITDAVLSFTNSAILFVLGLLPDVGPAPAAIQTLRHITMNLNYFLPSSEVVGFLPTMLATYVGLFIWRVIRLFLPGG